jgi:D-serine deaminase-like pyridoxal phosphate-dependent protein
MTETERDAPSARYFSAVNQTLRDAALARPCMLVDLDRVDHNLELIRRRLPPTINCRIVTKSLPSKELLSYVSESLGTRRLMAFHQPYLAWLVREFPDADILLGKPMLKDAVAEFYETVDAGARQEVSRRIQWLVDTHERLGEHLAFAKKHALRLRVNFEIDVGLRRGGVRSTGELERMLTLVAENDELLAFRGFMGYDGHVPYMPGDIHETFDLCMHTYADFVTRARALRPELFDEPLTLNSGGSKTYWLFDEAAPVNDIALGSAVLKPSTFAILDDHEPALFIAAPVIKKIERSARSRHVSLGLYGGGWAAELRSPPDIELGPGGDPPNQNLLPNQSVYGAPKEIPIEIGDFVFFHPQQSDAMFQFEDIVVLRDRRIIDTWKPVPIRY